MNTHFAPPERASNDEILQDVDLISSNPVISGLLHTASGLLAVLNEQRQILAVNDSFLRTLGITDPASILGLRPGEAVNCAHAHDMEAGCGTSKFCTTCGAAIAIVATLADNSIAERKCVITIDKKDVQSELCLAVRSCVIPYNDKRYILLFLQDITDIERSASIERIFFHDINNLIMGLHGAVFELNYTDSNTVSELSRTIQKIVARLSTEIAIQKVISQDEHYTYKLSLEQVTLDKILWELDDIFANHYAAKNKKILFPDTPPHMQFSTDLSLLLRILTNMLLNALEATEENGTVKLYIAHTDDTVTFSVWNKGQIPEKFRQRIFQHHFSTKKENGRGLGTYAMKLFGEKFMGGKVGFTSSEEDGTTFRFELPLTNK